MDLPVTIKPMGNLDRNDVIEIAESVLGLFHKYFIMRSLGSSRTLVAKVNGRVVGFIMYYTVRLSNIRLGVLYYMAVVSSYQGRGVGKQLLSEAERNLLSRVDAIIASTRLENEKVQEMFRSRGYTVLTWSELEDLTSWVVVDKLLKVLHAYDDDIVMVKSTSNRNALSIISQLT